MNDGIRVLIMKVEQGLNKRKHRVIGYASLRSSVAARTGATQMDVVLCENIIARDHYDNKVQNFIYAVEQSLINISSTCWKNKQTFISQMKNCELNIRTIDEGQIG